MHENAQVYKGLRLAVCSERRREILFSLNEGSKQLAEICNELESSPPAIIHSLRELEENHLVREDRTRKYELTPIGRIATRQCIDFNHAMDTLTKHETFWTQHDLSGIPDHMFDRIGSLRHSKLVVGTPIDISGAMRRFIELLEDTDLARLLSSVYVPGIAAIVLEKFGTQKTHIEFVLTEAVWSHFLDEAQYARQKELRKHLKLRMLHDDPKLVVLITEHFTTLSLFRTDETFDQASLLTSEDPEAIAWSQQLFNYYRAKSVDGSLKSGAPTKAPVRT